MLRSALRALCYTAAPAVAVAAAGLLLGSPAHATFKLRALGVTETGPVRGVVEDDMVAFRGIPYAKPPVGDLRWKPPQRAQRWHGFRDAEEFAPHCAQLESPFGIASNSEDCLYLNVYAPKRKLNNLFPLLKPVMVWFHGGAFFLGESDDFGPAPLVDEDVVVVTVNYRLGLAGFLAHPALTAESSYGGSGNYGLMDQQAALEWVKRNILFFGGDPRNVTIFGESAGGLSVHTHLASAGSAGLFDQAIIQSGAYALTQAPLVAAETLGQGFATAAGCPDQSITCLRALPIGSLLAVQGSAGFFPNLDNRVLTKTVRQSLTDGTFNQVPTLQGSNHDEWRLFVALDELATGAPLTAAGYIPAIARTLRITVPAATPIGTLLYPLAAYPSPSEALGAVGTDAIFACNARVSERLLSGFVPTYAFEFNDPDAPSKSLPPVSFPLGAFHGAEMQYLFDTRAELPAPPLNADQQALSDTMVRYWTNFAKRADPNGAGVPAWGAYTQATDTHQKLAPLAVAPITNFAADHKCSIWAPTP
jgi:para-nitrobenzyl esterase